MYSGEDSLGAQVRRTREQNANDAKKNGSGNNNKNNGGAKKQPAKKKAAAKKPQGGSGANGGKSGRHKSKTPAGTRTSAPGRNSSGRQASARANVQPKARKKKKR